MEHGPHENLGAADLGRRLRLARERAGSTQAQAAAEIEVARVRSYPPERPIVAGDVRAQAESDAIGFRHRLGIGGAPIRDVVSLLGPSRHHATRDSALELAGG